MRLFLLLFVFAYVCSRSTVNAAYCSGSPDEGERVNDFDINPGALEFVRSGDNAKLYVTGPENARFNVLHVYGNGIFIQLKD